MQTPEIILSRIDHLQEGLSQAVNEPGGARFALMLSMIWDSDLQARQAGSQGQDGQGALSPVNRLNLYTPELVGRLNASFHQGNMGDVHLLLSWLETAPLSRLPLAVEATTNSVPIEQAAVMAKKYTVLDEIHESQHRIAA